MWGKSLSFLPISCRRSDPLVYVLSQRILLGFCLCLYSNTGLRSWSNLVSLKKVFSKSFYVSLAEFFHSCVFFKRSLSKKHYMMISLTDFFILMNLKYFLHFRINVYMLFPLFNLPGVNRHNIISTPWLPY